MIADQAEALRALAGMAKARQEPINREPGAEAARLLAFASGKGGVGKTTMVANLALALAESGHRVMVLDADLGLANIDLLFGISPTYTLGNVVRGEQSLADIITTGPKGVMIVPGGSGLKELADLPRLRRQELIHSIQRLRERADIILMDTAAGVSQDVLGFVTFADRVVVVTTPEPTAVTDAYALMKLGLQEGQSNFALVVNMAKSAAEATATAKTLISVTKRFLGLPLDYLGSVPVDAHVSSSIRQQTPLALAFPDCPAAVSLSAIAGTMFPGDGLAPETGVLAGVLCRLAGIGNRQGKRAREQ
ncbi:MAG: MinD/ParA family protein [Chloroflexi bacterium]|nr:MinD/ParA family protein [Chloroflexota bacterium]